MISGPPRWVRVERRRNGWWCLDEGWASNFRWETLEYGPYRYRWVARMMKWCIDG